MSQRMNRSALVERPLKTSQPTGATLAALGVEGTIPLMHGSQGCSAFAKVYLIQHFREPVPLQNTAIDQVAAVMGGDDNLSDALLLLCNKHKPALIAVITTGLTEMQGSDIQRLVKEFHVAHPEHQGTRIVPMATPDFVGSMQTGYALAIDALVKTLVQPPKPKLIERKSVNVLCSCALTPADVDLLKDYLDAFELDAVVLPDLSLSMDGHLAKKELSATSTGGTKVTDIERMASADATLVFGDSLLATASWLQKSFDIPVHSFGMAMGVEACDKLVFTLSQISGKPVPKRLERARTRLQDTMLDCHFILSSASMAIAQETDLASGYLALLTEQGIEVPRVVSATPYPNHKLSPAQEHIVGDLSDLDEVLEQVELVVGNTHVANQCEPNLPVLRAGYPCHDRYGSGDTLQVGYEGTRSRLFALANLLKANHQDEVAAHYSQYRFEPEQVTPSAVLAEAPQERAS